MILAGETLITWRKTCNTAHFVQHEFHVDWLGTQHERNSFKSEFSVLWLRAGPVMGYGEHGNAIILKFSIPCILTLEYTL